jgi:pimeloyl-ACP methyl ester carboxylesterase
MKTHCSLPQMVFGLVLFSVIAHTNANTVLSNRTFVDTRGVSIPSNNATNRNPLEGVPRLIDKKFEGHRLISHEMPKQSLPRPEKDTVTVYLQIKIPDFSGKNGGWGSDETGLGAFYGLEMQASSALTPVDTIQYKIGGAPPKPDTPTNSWTPTTFNQLIDIPLGRSTVYFKIKLGSGSFGGVFGSGAPGPLMLSARFKSARLCKGDGLPVRQLDSSFDLWVISHGKSDGEDSFRPMNRIVGSGGTRRRQVVSLDWASGAKGEVSDLTNGRYFINLGGALGKLLRSKIHPSKINWVGHSWGTYVGCETARSLSEVKRFIALDPALLALYYDNKRINFRRFSKTSTGVKGGGDVMLLGSKKLANTCDYSIMLLAGWKGPGFYHSLPRAWFTQAVSRSSDPYWDTFNEILLRKQVTLAGLFGNVEIGKTLDRMGKIDGFDLRHFCPAEERNGKIQYESHHQLKAKESDGTLVEITLRKASDGSTWWRFKG